MTFTDYSEAYNAAVRRARELRDAGLPLEQCEQGLEHNELFGYFHFRTLPSPENRVGHELRCEVVRPSDPLTDSPNKEQSNG